MAQWIRTILNKAESDAAGHQIPCFGPTYTYRQVCMYPTYVHITAMHVTYTCTQYTHVTHSHTEAKCRNRQTSGVHWPTNLAVLAGLALMRKPCLRHQGGEP